MGMYMDHNITFIPVLPTPAVDLCDKICSIIEREPHNFRYLDSGDFEPYCGVTAHFETTSFSAHEDINDEFRFLALKIPEVKIFYHCNMDNESSSVRSIFHGEDFEEAWAEITYKFNHMEWED